MPMCAPKSLSASLCCPPVITEVGHMSLLSACVSSAGIWSVLPRHLTSGVWAKTDVHLSTLGGSLSCSTRIELSSRSVLCGWSSVRFCSPFPLLVLPLPSLLSLLGLLWRFLAVSLLSLGCPSCCPNMSLRQIGHLALWPLFPQDETHCM